MSGVRCFVGIPLPTDTTGPLVAACDAVRRCAPEWRGEKWVSQQNLHVTLAFVGNVAAEAVPALSEAVGAVVKASPAFELAFRGVRAVPSPRRARMLWADYDDPSGLCASLAEKIVSAAEPFGAKPPDRQFSAHVTLVRARHARRVPAEALELANAAAEAVPNPMSVLCATLFASKLTSSGPVYEVIGEWRLPGR